MLFSMNPKFKRWDVVELETPMLSNTTKTIGIVVSINRGIVRFILKDASTATYDGNLLVFDRNKIGLRQASVTPTGINLADIFNDYQTFLKNPSEGWDFAKELSTYDSKHLNEVFGEFHLPGVLQAHSYESAKNAMLEYEEHKPYQFGFGDKVCATLDGHTYEGVVIHKYNDLNCYSVAFPHLAVPQSINANDLFSANEAEEYNQKQTL